MSNAQIWKDMLDDSMDKYDEQETLPLPSADNQKHNPHGQKTDHPSL